MPRCGAIVLAAALSATDALVLSLPAASVPHRRASACIMQHSKGWDDFGKPPFNFYKGFDSFMSVFPDEDRNDYPEMFRLPDGCYEVAMPKPLGIAFSEREVRRRLQTAAARA